MANLDNRAPDVITVIDQLALPRTNEMADAVESLLDTYPVEDIETEMVEETLRIIQQHR